MGGGNAPTGRLSRIIAYFRRHPVLLLLAFTPGIPEYLSGSSAVWLIVVNPGVFFLFLGLNLGLYGPGVLLVREAHVRWNKGWSTVLLLGAAYGLLEEGTALSTLFNPKASVVSSLGSYGHAYGVSWVWLIGVLGIHMVYSVGIPILLLGLALPQTRGQPFLTGRRLATALGIYAFDIVLLAYIEHYRAGLGLILLAAVVAGLLWLVAWRLPAGLFEPTAARPSRSPALFFVAGVAYFPILLVAPGIGEDLHWPALVSGILDLVLVVLLFLGIRRGIGRSGNGAQLTALAIGTLVPIVVFGAFAQLFLPVVLILDAVVVWFFLTLWRHYRPAAPPVPVPAVVTV